MQRGSGQRAAGAIIPDAPVISHPKDWETVPESMRDTLSKTFSERHPDRNLEGPKKKKSKKKND
jgi:hypothetical protein